MNEIGSRKLSRTNGESADGIHLQTGSIAVREILQGGVLVGTNKGIIRKPLKSGIKIAGGHNVSEDDFEDVTTELLLREDTCETSLSDGITFWVESDVDKDATRGSNNNNNNFRKSLIKGESNSNKISILYSVPEGSNDNDQGVTLEEFTDCEEGLVGFSNLNYPLFDKSMEQIDELDSLATSQLSDSIRILSASSQILKDAAGKKSLVNNKKSLILKNNNVKPVISVQKIIDNLSSDGDVVTFKSKSKLCNGGNNFASLLAKSSVKSQGSYAYSEETSDNSEATSKPATKRGGWPKGRKRKPEIKSEICPPKAPATGYVIFLNERRKDYKDLPFTEVTKLLGNEWSKLSLQEKKVYLDQAEVEKKRYREELKFYRQSDAYQTYLHNKRLKRLQGNGTEESDMDATDEIDDEDNEELYCRTCDQWFHSLHNKKEHLYGRQHLQSIAGRFNKATDPDWRNPNMSSTSFDESSLDGSSYLKGSKDHCCNKNCGSLNMDDAIVRFMAANQEREEERRILRDKLEEAKARNAALAVSLQECNTTLNSLTCMAESERTTQILLEQRLFNLLNVPTLFYLPEPLNEDNN